MAILQSNISPASEDFAANRAMMAELAADLTRHRSVAAAGGSEKSRERHPARGKPCRASG